MALFLTRFPLKPFHCQLLRTGFRSEREEEAVMLCILEWLRSRLLLRTADFQGIPLIAARLVCVFVILRRIMGIVPSREQPQDEQDLECLVILLLCVSLKMVCFQWDLAKRQQGVFGVAMNHNGYRYSSKPDLPHIEALGAGSSNMDGATRPQIAHGHQSAAQFLPRQKKTDRENAPLLNIGTETKLLYTIIPFLE
ncbi:hypothetical protein Tco_0548373 [Tanacetum coccineum]